MAAAKKARPKAAAPSTEKAKPPAGEAKPKSPAQPETKAKAKTKTKAPSSPKGKPAARAKAAGSSRHSTSSPDIYTDPKLRDKLKEEITAGDKGGKPGQWSARKAQLLAHEYEKAGGDYKNGKKKKTDSQQHLDSWTKEDWKTADDQPADRDGGTTRYLPAEAWDQLTPAQKKATNSKKQAGSKQGKQFVANTDEAKTARKAATKSAAPPEESQAAPKKKQAPRKKAEPKAKAPKKSSS